ncbi:MAG: tyrosine-type recombinase/integrase [Phycisphaerales bacterium JB065]
MTPPLTREDLIGRYNAHARAYYRRADGSPTRHAQNIELATRPLRSQLSAESFGLEDLRAYREQLIKRGLKRRTINQWVGWVRGMFRWGAREQLLPASTAAELTLLDPLRYGRSMARESSIPMVITRAQLLEVLPHLPSVVARMVQVQWLCGMRVSELVSMRSEDLVEIDDYLVYVPAHHKTEHHERDRRIVICAEARAHIDEGLEGLQFVNSIGNPYNRNTYGAAIRRACRRNNLRTWTPGGLHRSAATHARRLVGSEGVQRLLGHASSDMTERYFGLEVIDAIEVARGLDAAGWSLSGTTDRKPLTRTPRAG